VLFRFGIPTTVLSECVCVCVISSSCRPFFPIILISFEIIAFYPQEAFVDMKKQATKRDLTDLGGYFDYRHFLNFVAMTKVIVL
jgi:hypothetical protein